MNKKILQDIQNEYDYAVKTYGNFTNIHEAYGVLAEEMYEVLKAIHENKTRDTYMEVSQVAAVCFKTLELLNKKLNDNENN